MKKVLMIFIAMMSMLVFSNIVSARPLPPHPAPVGYVWKYVCFNTMFPYPHSECSYQLVRVYTPVYHRRHYAPGPPPPRVPHHDNHKALPPRHEPAPHNGGHNHHR